ncbi:MAG: phosphatidylserine decarboxylase [Clostridiales bacterium]|nr:phosphatidylserine decarboxylase [Clostridiales bacterium]MDU3244266.1 phosphatidylserine decarboxylase [Clostridiales bacterium]
MSVYPIEESGTYKIKNTEYHLEQLFDSIALAKKFLGGYCMIFSLTPRHYHKYFNICDRDKIKPNLLGYVIHMEIGALRVGKICNNHSGSKVLQDQEKGYFEFGGSRF